MRATRPFPAILASLVLALVAVGLPIPAWAAPSPTPAGLAYLGDSRQVVIVTAPSWRSTTATLSTYERSGDSWTRVHGPTPAFLGYGGLAPAAERRQGTGTTPAGAFDIVSAFGRRADPGTQLPYRRVDGNDAWTYNPRVPATYNVFQDAPVSWRSYGKYVERLESYGRQYDFVAVLGYNLPEGRITRSDRGVRRTDQPADTRAGGGIFLHVSNGKPTAGCISIPHSTMRSVLAWLDPAKDPVLVVGPRAKIASFSRS